MPDGPYSYSSWDGTVPEMVFWERCDGRLKIIRHCDGVFSLLHDDNIVKQGSFKETTDYAWMEFDILLQFGM
jgi:hypothetical protein